MIVVIGPIIGSLICLINFVDKPSFPVLVLHLRFFMIFSVRDSSMVWKLKEHENFFVRPRLIVVGG